MKLFILMISLAFLIPAHAEYHTLSCSNATGTIIWEEGENSNMARLTYSGFVTGALDIDRHKLDIKKNEEVNLRQRILPDCAGRSSHKVFATRVVITPSTEHPDVFMSYFPDNRIEADVICEKIVSSQSTCLP